MSYNDSVSQDIKLDLNFKRCTVCCLAQSIDMSIGTALCQHTRSSNYNDI